MIKDESLRNMDVAVCSHSCLCRGNLTRSTGAPRAPAGVTGGWPLRNAKRQDRVRFQHLS